MTKEQKLLLMKNRFSKILNSPKSAKCPGVKQKLARQIRNLENQ